MMLWNYADGMIQLKIMGAEPGQTLLKITEQGIMLSEIQWVDELTVTFLCFRKDRQAVSAICIRQGDDVCFLREKGFVPLWKQAMSRPFLTFGIIILLSLTLFLPTRILFFQVEGNNILPDHRILEAAQSCGIRFGVSRRIVRSEQMKNRILEELPELKWAGINTAGCTAVISVREQPIQEPQTVSSGVSSIIASRDGRITSCTVTKGNSLCAPGQIVREGELLVSGYTDCGLCVRVTEAEGEIFAQTFRQINVVTPAKCVVRQSKTNTEKRYSVILGKNRINLWKDSGISDTTCDRMYEEYYITLPGGFRLPICLTIETLTQWQTVESTRAPQELKPVMESFARKQMLNDAIAGRILQEDHTYSEESEIYCLKSSAFCSEMIGRVITEEIGETNGKTD